MLGDVGQRLARHRHQFGAELVADGGVDRAVEADDRFEAEAASGLRAQLDQLLAQRPAGEAQRVQLEDRRPHVAHRAVEVVDGGEQPTFDGGIGGEAHGRLQCEAGGEQSLDDRVVEVARNALTILDRRQLGDASVEACVLDGRAGGDSEADGELLVDVGERVLALLVAEVEVAEHGAADHHRHAEERSHRRMVRWETEARRVFAQIGEAQRLRIDDQQAEDPVALGEVADRRTGFLVDADRDELGQP